MVTGYIATEVGDKIIAKLVDPYLKVNSIQDWNIKSGFSNEFTAGKLTFETGNNLVTGIGTNLDLNNGDIILAGGYEFVVDETPTNETLILQTPSQVDLTNVTFYIKSDQYNYFSYEFRWSQNDVIEKGGEHSVWHPLNKGTLVGDLLSINFDNTMPLWLEIRATVEDIQPLHELIFLSITYTIEYEDGTVVECPQTCVDCEPFELDGCANIIVECDAANLYNPYGLQKPAHLYKSLSNLANNVYGHNVTYYRVEPNVRSRDVILKEYSLYDVIEKASIKVMVPNNEFPTEQANFDIFGMGFEDFEIHITGEEFRKHFGENKIPRSRDYLYFPFNNKMYEVSMTSLADEFNRELTYFKVMLKKYENRTSTNKEGFKEDLTDLVKGVEEIFGEEIKEEQEKVTKPLQYQSTHHKAQDGVRKFVHKDLALNDINLKNRWTVVTRNYYDMSTVLADEFQAPAVVYEAMSNLKMNENRAFTFWVNPTNTFNFTNSENHEIIDGTNILDKGLSINISNMYIKIIINAQEYSFQHNIILSKDKWYGVVVNLSNTYGEVSAYIYVLDKQNNYTDPTGQTNLEQAFAGNLETLSPHIWETDVNWSLRGNKFNVTNIRMFDKTIEEEQHTNVLQQYVVRDSQHALIIDNAIPSLQLQKFGSSR
jgi:hypothetical protein